LSEGTRVRHDGDEHVWELVDEAKTVCTAETVGFGTLLTIGTMLGERRKGYATWLLFHVEQVARRKGLATMEARDILSDDAIARSFFENAGYILKPRKGDDDILDGSKNLWTDFDQRPRIALIEHHTSQMQSYKTHILTAAILILTVFEVWFRVETPNRGFAVAGIMSVALGAILASAIAFVARATWFGQLVRSAVHAPMGTQVSTDSLMGKLDDEITRHAQLKVAEKGTGRIEQTVKRFTRLGDHTKTAELWAIWLASCFAISVAVFFVSPMFGLRPAEAIAPSVFIILAVLTVLFVVLPVSLTIDC
jgi:hypothetical protein